MLLEFEHYGYKDYSFLLYLFEILNDGEIEFNYKVETITPNLTSKFIIRTLTNTIRIENLFKIERYNYEIDISFKFEE